MHPKMICDWGFVLTFFSDGLRKNHDPGHLATDERKGGLLYRTPQPAHVSTPAGGQQGGHALTTKGTSPPLCASPEAGRILAGWGGRRFLGCLTSLFHLPALVPPTQSSAPSAAATASFRGKLGPRTVVFVAPSKKKG